MPADFYDLLEVDEDASESEIERAYRDKATRYHPDVNDDPRATDQFATLNKARDVLTDAKERARYDRLGHRDYVSQHLDGLPTMTRPGQEEAEEPEEEAEAPGSGTARETGTSGGPGADSTDDSPEYGPGTGGSGSATNRTRSRSSGSSARSSSPGSSRATGSRSSTTAASSTSTGETSHGSGTSSASSTSASTSAGASTRTGTGRSTSRSTSPASSPRRVGLRRGWIAAVVALALYLAGLGAYTTGASEGVATALSALQADPLRALTASSPLADPVSITRAAVETAMAGEPTLALLVPVGLVALPLTVTVSVVRFGQGTAYLYGAGVVVPLVWVGVRPAVTAPLAADLLALGAVPLLAALWFLVDVGRYLRA